MLLAAIATLTSDHPDRPWPDRPQTGLNGWLYQGLLRDTAPALATAVHDQAGDKPLTIAALPTQNAGELCLRVTALQRDLAAVLLGGLVRAAADATPVNLDGVTGRVARVVTDPAAHPLAATQNWSDLLDTRPARAWRFRFHTPTTFKTGDVEQPLPVPKSLWGSWLRRWNTWAPPELAFDGGFLDLFDRYAGLTSLLLRTGTVSAKGGRPAVGFVGTVTVEATRQTPAEVLHALTVLARFSHWSGTGRQTLYGMGVTQWLPAGEPSHTGSRGRAAAHRAG